MSPSTNSPAPTSLQRGLLISLAVVLLSCTLILVGAAYAYYLITIEADIEEHADQYAENLSISMERLLWTLDDEAVINVGMYYKSLPDVSALRVMNSFGDVVFFFDKELPDTVVTRDVQVLYQGDVVGFVRLALSTAPHTARNMELLRTAMILVLIVGGIMLIFTYVILRRFLRRPLSHLNELASTYASGEFDLEEPQSPSREFQGVVSALSHMGRTIRAQISELQKAEAAYRSIFENTAEGLVQTLPDGRVSKLNPTMAQMLGHDSPEQAFASQAATSAGVYADPSRRKELLEQVKKHGEVRSFETELLRADGEKIVVSINSRGTFENGELVLLDSVVENITERKQAEAALQAAHQELEDRVEQRTRELQQANERLRNLDDLKSALLSAVSHDIRTPLTSVLGFAKLASKDFTKFFAPEQGVDPALEAKGERILRCLDTIVEEGERLTRLINDYLDLTKIESGRIVWNDRDLDVGELVARAIKAVEFVIEEAPHVELKTSFQEGLPKIHADEDRMLQVLVNLLDNAVKYTPEGEILVSTRFNGENMLEIRIADTGRGIPEPDLPMVFDKFHQVDREDTLGDIPKGTGLGLAICRQIVEHYGGRISVDSTLGRGSVFTIVLPVASADSA
ncbi:MAG: PAS domain S-box protein [Desulfovibrio sp.]|nr:MAG: PAS domain S-box protein [Desulfovibrio sp.]